MRDPIRAGLDDSDLVLDVRTGLGLSAQDHLDT